MDYVGALPDKRYFGAETMTEKAKAEFEKWHERESRQLGNNYVMREQLVAYCESDVDILMQTCMKYRDIMLTTAFVDVFVEAMTIAS